MNTSTRLLTLSAALASLAVASEAHAGFTLHGSAGISYIVSGLEADRGPLTLDVAPGWDFGLVRLELPFVFGLEDADDLFPPAPGGFLGLRPQVKLFPLGGLYAKAAAQILVPAGDETYVGASLGGGFELKLGPVAVNAEVNVNPFFTPATVLPVDLRLGATLLF
jgi:hypothetical protein